MSDTDDYNAYSDESGDDQGKPISPEKLIADLPPLPEKLEGGEQFKKMLVNGDYEGAIKGFLGAIRSAKYVLDKEEIQDEDMKEKRGEFATLLLQYQLNLSLAYMRVAEYSKGLQVIEDILENHPTHRKALFRKAQLQFDIQEYDKSLGTLDILDKALNVLDIEEGRKASAMLRGKVTRANREYKKEFKKLAGQLMPNLSSPPTPPRTETNTQVPTFSDSMSSLALGISDHFWIVFSYAQFLFGYILNCINVFLYNSMTGLIESAWTPEARAQATAAEDKMLANKKLRQWAKKKVQEEQQT